MPGLAGDIRRPGNCGPAAGPGPDRECFQASGFICTTVAVSADDSAEQCTSWGAFPAGQIEVAGMSHSQDTIHHWAVIGGTGVYDATRGTLTARDLSRTMDELTIWLGSTK